ncbi:flavin reductase family protein [Limnohabitans sp.]|uniref:flavin reductase family protein n=1 Tax=Limnohabitans sp. TaxID=1907725 RepID=UPI00334143CB
MSTKSLFDRLDFRKALGCFGTGVAVVTAKASDSRLVGVTANSFSSVSLEPAIVLWSLQKTSPNLSAYDDCGRFVINVLSLSQIEYSKRFASPVPDKFNGVDYALGIHDLPVLNGCAATFECRTIQRLDVGDHILYLGEVEAYQHQNQAALLYVQGRYAQSASAEPHPA